MSAWQHGSRDQPPPPRGTHSRAYQRAFQRLDESLERASDFSNAEVIAAMRKAYFADVDKLQASGKLVLPG